MVKLEGSYTFSAPQEIVWQAVQDPKVLSQILPGCERLTQTGPNEYEGEIKIRVGPILGNFQGTVKLSDINAPESYHLVLEGQGRPGFVQGAGDLSLATNGDGETTLAYAGEAQLSGRIASVGQRLVDSTARSITRQGLESLDRQIQARLHPPQPQPVPAEEVETDASLRPAPESASGFGRPAPEAAPPTAAEVGVKVAQDVAVDLAKEWNRTYTGRDVLVILSGFVVIQWMYRRLFKG